MARNVEKGKCPAQISVTGPEGPIFICAVMGIEKCLKDLRIEQGFLNTKVYKNYCLADYKALRTEFIEYRFDLE